MQPFSSAIKMWSIIVCIVSWKNTTPRLPVIPDHDKSWFNMWPHSSLSLLIIFSLKFCWDSGVVFFLLYRKWQYGIMNIFLIRDILASLNTICLLCLEIARACIAVTRRMRVKKQNKLHKTQKKNRTIAWCIHDTRCLFYYNVNHAATWRRYNYLGSRKLLHSYHTCFGIF